jgi:hypothetical protein
MSGIESLGFEEGEPSFIYLVEIPKFMLPSLLAVPERMFLRCFFSRIRFGSYILNMYSLWMVSSMSSLSNLSKPNCEKLVEPRTFVAAVVMRGSISRPL